MRLLYLKLNEATTKSYRMSYKNHSNAQVLDNWLQGFTKGSATLDAQISAVSPNFSELKINRTPELPGLVHVQLNRPKFVNALSLSLWSEIDAFFDAVEKDSSVKCIILSGEGRGFSSGMDLKVFMDLRKKLDEEKCEGRKREQLNCLIARLQYITSAPERSRVPVIASVHGICIGAALDLVAACDLRYSDITAVFSVKEVDLAIIADLGALQRLPKLIGEQQTKELAYTGRNMSGKEAEKIGLVSTCWESNEELTKQVHQIAKSICGKSELAIRGIKESIQYARDHSTIDSLQQVRMHNAAVLLNTDLDSIISAFASRNNSK
uniref:Delta(3) putative n=1 Tax=Albugo laibachii Nc14 TaxID=890382 RepID=F0WUV4_9STRA|nr:Delta(3) putative [Albugo laibachii Nc14]|eukprot:CCA25190.1 Delta(3) putative [Albugo laibachii Nc14]